MAQVTEPPYQTEKYIRNESNDFDEYLQDPDQELINNDTSLPNGLRRLREDRTPSKDSNNSKMINHLEIARFSTESLHSYNFVSSDASMYENRQNILRRSIDFMKSKIKGWKFLDVHQVLLSLVEPATGTSTDIVLPQEETGVDDSRFPRKPKITLNTLSDIPALPSTLHSPTRFTPQNQAIITTDHQGNILNANDIACLIFSYSRAEISTIKAFDLIASPYREKQEKSLALRPQNDHDNCEAVLACGKVIPIQRKNEETSAASLWLKAKKDDVGNSIFIWIFEEIVESMMTAEIDEKGIIRSSSGDVKALYGYTPEEIVGMRVTTLIPALEVIPLIENNNNMNINNANVSSSPDTRLDIEQINKTKYYGSRSKNCAKFPIIGKISMPSIQEEMYDQESTIYRLKIISMPTIAGVITAHATGIIQSCNSVFVKYLFGVGSHELIGKRYIESLLPQFSRLMDILASERSLVEGVLISENAFRRAAASISATSTNKVLYSHTKDFSSTSQSIQGPSGIIAVHRDGTEFDVDIQMRVVESPDEPLHALWITFDRSANFAKEPSYFDNVYNHSERFEINRHLGDEKIQEEKENFNISRFIEVGGKPPISTSLSSDRQIITPPVMSPAPEPFDPMSYSAITLGKTIDDFEILDNLGQGAYGQVKLAYNKNDNEKKRVVLKYIVKTRILVDCWTRDKALGTVPLEIHILHTLRRYPHPNIVQMVDFFEDDDYYYIEMGLHGAGMDLFDYIELNTAMAEDEIKLIFRQVARAIQHLHHRNIVHRDIKDENVILDENGNVQLIDFGSSAYIKAGKKYDTFCGTIDYAAPEVLTGKKYDGPPQDIWALGILLYTLIYKENPFYNIDEIIARDLRIPYILSDGSIDLVKKMLDRDVDKRPSIDDVLNHHWLWEE
ncbi:13365_t:CDS:2 [Gigaspora margarita]|uniref:13365_t:CDS:1 n=1 Tax=Gigaspora margarita TaxID=4874 RepID=A0ABN7UKT8_GIGMA|nr:13365_t:CDS:2 [Gigaspora margarita]